MDFDFYYNGLIIDIFKNNGQPQISILKADGYISK